MVSPRKMLLLVNRVDKLLSPKALFLESPLILQRVFV